MGGAIIGEPGASADAEYRRRLDKDRARRSAELGNSLQAAVIAGIAVAVGFQYFYHSNGVAIGALFGLVVLLGRLAPKVTTRAWSIGVEGELRTARELDPLASRGYVVMHDLRISMSRANIDHLVIGPTGVFVIETKNIRGKVRIDGQDVRMGGRRVALVDEVRNEVRAVWDALGSLLEPMDVKIQAIVCAHRAELPWFRRNVAAIQIVYPGRLRGAITDGPELLSPIEIAELRARAERLLPPRSARRGVV